MKTLVIAAALLSFGAASAALSQQSKSIDLAELGGANSRCEGSAGTSKRSPATKPECFFNTAPSDVG